MTGNHLQLSDITEWDMTKCVPPEHADLIMDLLNNKRLWQSVQPITDARMYTKMLQEDKDIDLYIVTATSPHTTEIKIDLLHKYFPWIDIKNQIIITNNKQIINVNLMVDDYEQNLINGNYFKLLYTYQWNRSFNALKNGMIRVNNWIDIYSIIQNKIEAHKQVEEIMV